MKRGWKLNNLRVRIIFPFPMPRHCFQHRTQSRRPDKPGLFRSKAAARTLPEMNPLLPLVFRGRRNRPPLPSRQKPRPPFNRLRKAPPLHPPLRQSRLSLPRKRMSPLLPKILEKAESRVWLTPFLPTKTPGKPKRLCIRQKPRRKRQKTKTPGVNPWPGKRIRRSPCRTRRIKC